MAFRGVRDRRAPEPRHSVQRPPRRLAVVALAAVLVALSVVVVTGRATGSGPTRCETFSADSVARSGSVSGAGEDVLVIGDSWTAGLGLEDPTGSWPTRLPGRVHVAGFSGSGFSAGASGCGPQVSFAARARAALRPLPPGTPVVVAGGLNDWDMSAADIRAGFERLLGQLDGHPLTVVGPADAPARSAYVPRVEGLLERLCAEHGVRFVAVSDLALDYLPDLLHLTPAGHARFGDAVAARLSTAG
ncbi:SGNH/GDSL hydrolase family protein [Nocardioides marinus]|uniref:Acyl-CoA thioesterase-1 n=1 Tax=Nocardioides marinus TaxID=374514 RepID=A0A7Y9YB82_9ACTN|nr:SGNH/GDSL hydrolase family protein [Nocardioides marinus]NYI08976.1 acyl-CoA thioesterase-1 [Nocardioides marinus]